MKSAIKHRPKYPSVQRERGGFRLVLLGVLLVVMTSGMAFGADATPPKDSQTIRLRPRQYVKHPASKTQQPASAVAQTPPVPKTPAAPPLPDWPANSHPVPAKVVWDSHGLRVEASNSSLDQILHEVAADTGAKVEGLSQDQRIFGTFGPGPARDVLTQLLDGSGYNLLLIGDMGQGTPRQIVLSTRNKGTGQTAARPTQPQDDDDSADEPEPQPEPVQMQPQQPPPPQPQQMQGNPFGGGGAPRSPQEIMQELQMRQQQMQQQQQPQ